MTAVAQRWLAITIVLAATAYLAWRGWRAWRATADARHGTNCGPGCGCS